MGRIRDAVLDWATEGPRVAITHFLDPQFRAKSVQTVSQFGQGVVHYTDWNIRKAILEGYNAHFLVYRCMTMRANAIRSLPFTALDATTGELVSDTHPAAKMLAVPNPSLSMGDVKYRAELFLCLAGDAYWFINQMGDSVRLDPLRSDRVTIKPYRDKATGKQHRIYVYTLNGGKTLFESEEIVHISLFNPGDDLFGLPPLRAAAKVVDIGNAIQDFQFNSLKNGVWPSGTLNTKALGDKEYKRLMEQLKEQKEGPANARTLLILEEGRGFTPAAPTPVEMDLMGGAGLTNEQLCIGMGIPVEATGLVSAKYENQRQAKRSMWEDTIIPEGDTFIDAMNIQLAPVFDNVRFAYDLSNTLPMVEARKDSIESAEKIWKMGVPWNVINKTMKLGFEEVDGGDVGYVPAMVLPVGSARGEERSGPYTAIEMMRMPRERRRRILEEVARSINPETDEQMEVYWRVIDRRKQSWERGVAIQVGERFAKESKVVVAAIESGKTKLDKVIDGQRSAWKELIAGIQRTVIKDAGEWLADQLNTGKSEVGGRAIETREVYEFDPWNELIREWVTTHTAENVTTILDTTKKAIQRTVLAGLDADKTTPQIARMVRDQFSEWEKGDGVYRSMRIARTEVHAATGFGHHESARQSGVVKKKHWQDAGDDRVRDAHRENTAAGWIDFDELYPNGASFPGDGTDDVLCRCAELYRTKS